MSTMDELAKLNERCPHEMITVTLPKPAVDLIGRWIDEEELVMQAFGGVFNAERARGLGYVIFHMAIAMGETIEGMESDGQNYEWIEETYEKHVEDRRAAAVEGSDA